MPLDENDITPSCIGRMMAELVEQVNRLTEVDVRREITLVQDKDQKEIDQSQPIVQNYIPLRIARSAWKIGMEVEGLLSNNSDENIVSECAQFVLNSCSYLPTTHLPSALPSWMYVITNFARACLKGGPAIEELGADIYLKALDTLLQNEHSILVDADPFFPPTGLDLQAVHACERIKMWDSLCAFLMESVRPIAASHFVAGIIRYKVNNRIVEALLARLVNHRKTQGMATLFAAQYQLCALMLSEGVHAPVLVNFKSNLKPWINDLLACLMVEETNLSRLKDEPRRSSCATAINVLTGFLKSELRDA